MCCCHQAAAPERAECAPTPESCGNGVWQTWLILTQPELNLVPGGLSCRSLGSAAEPPAPSWSPARDVEPPGHTGGLVPLPRSWGWHTGCPCCSLKEILVFHSRQLTFVTSSHSPFFAGQGHYISTGGGCVLKLASSSRNCLLPPGQTTPRQEPTLHQLPALCPRHQELATRGACPAQGHTAVITTSKCSGKAFVLFVT